MANQEHIRRQVESVRDEARSLISRYRAERRAKYATAAPPAKQVEAPRLEPQPAREKPTTTHAQELPLFSASPDIDKFFAGHLRSAAAAETARPAPTSEPPVKAAPKRQQAAPAIKRDAGLHLGLEPVFGVPPQAQKRADASSSPVGGSRDEGAAIGLKPIVERKLVAEPLLEPIMSPPVVETVPEPAPQAQMPSRQEDLPVSTLIAIGPALGLKLKDLGIHTLHDLARADEVELRAKLGSIGALVRADAWIAEAQKAVASADVA